MTGDAIWEESDLYRSATRIHLDDTVRAFTKKACDEVRRTGHTVIESDCIITDNNSAQSTGLAFAASNLDGVVILFAGWMECPFTMSLAARGRTSSDMHLGIPHV